MLSTARIDDISRDVAERTLPSHSVERVESTETIDSEGQSAVRVLIVLRPNVVQKLKGDAVLDTLVSIQNKLSDAGEERLSIVEYATEDELRESADSEA
jgi:hypothetical protein